MYPKRLIAYMSVVELVALAVLVHSFVIGTGWIDWQLFVFLGSVFVAAFFPIVLPKGNGTVGVEIPMVVAASIVLGPSAGFWIGMLGTLNQRQLTGKVKWPSVLFNRAQFGLVGWVGGTAFDFLGGSLHRFTYGHEIFPVVAACVVAYLGNMGMVGGAISLRQHRNLYEVWRGYFSWMSLNYFVMMPLVFLMVVVYRIGGAWPEFIFLVPLALSRWIYVLLLRIRRMYALSVQAMLTSLQAKDEYTYGHSMRVGHYAKLLARHMGLSEERAELIEQAGRLHDIGKVGMPDDILKKPAGLQIEEILVMQRHPTLGGEILETLELLGCVRNGAVYHHERFDGSGYPFRLKGQEIPLETRIISVVDTYDAMTSTRPYRAALAHQIAVREIERGAGTQFDPAIVDAFLDLAKTTNLALAEGSKFDSRQSPPPPGTFHPG